MKTVLIGDIHGRTIWKDIVNKEDPDRVIFVGDYFDSKEYSIKDQLDNFIEILDYKNNSGKEVVLLIGNHDFHYFPEIDDSSTSGFSSALKISASRILDENRKDLKIAYRFDDILCSHAGVSSTFMDLAFEDGWKVSEIDLDLNDLFKYRPYYFGFGFFHNNKNIRTRILNPYGDNMDQSPIWIRERSLMESNKKNPVKKEVIQFFGHTEREKIDRKGKSTGGRYYNIDCLGTSREYAIIQDGVIDFGSIEIIKN